MKRPLIAVWILLLFAVATTAQAPSAPGAPTDAERLFLRGLTKYNKREFLDAALLWKSALEKDIHHEKTKEFMEQAFAKYDAMQKSFFGGVKYYNSSDIAGAIRELKSCLVVNPRHREALYYLKLCYQKQRIATTVEDLERKFVADAGSIPAPVI